VVWQLSGYKDHEDRAWNVRTGELIFQRRAERVEMAVLGWDQNYLVPETSRPCPTHLVYPANAERHDGRFDIVSTNSGKTTSTIDCPKLGPTLEVWLLDGGYLMLTDWGATVIAEIATGRIVGRYGPAPELSYSYTAWGPVYPAHGVIGTSGGLMVTVTPEIGYVALREIATGRERTRFFVGSQRVHQAILVDGNRRALVLSAGVLSIFDCRDGRLLFALGAGGDIESMEANAAGDTIVLYYKTAPEHGRHAEVFRRNRPADWWGVFWLREFWFTVVLSVLFLSSLFWRGAPSWRSRT
jgi:hypothetical protein